MNFAVTSLEGYGVKLEPLSLHHREGLCRAIEDGKLWQIHLTLVPHPDDIDAFFANAQKAHDAGDGISFAIIDQRTGQIAGSTRFMRAMPAHKKVEIGYSFLGRSWQQTQVNTASKLLLLTHAFEPMALHRVEFITDFLNSRSRNAIMRLGAKEEGIMRNHMIMPDGRERDSVLYSIVKHEWPGVQQHLRWKLTEITQSA